MNWKINLSPFSRQENDANLDGIRDYAGVDFNGDGEPDNGAILGLAEAEVLHGEGGNDDIDWGGGRDRIYGDDFPMMKQAA